MFPKLEKHLIIMFRDRKKQKWHVQRLAKDYYY